MDGKVGHLQPGQSGSLDWTENNNLAVQDTCLKQGSQAQGSSIILGMCIADSPY